MDAGSDIRNAVINIHKSNAIKTRCDHDCHDKRIQFIGKAEYHFHTKMTLRTTTHLIDHISIDGMNHRGGCSVSLEFIVRVIAVSVSPPHCFVRLLNIKLLNVMRAAIAFVGV